MKNLKAPGNAIQNPPAMGKYCQRRKKKLKINKYIKTCGFVSVFQNIQTCPNFQRCCVTVVC